MALLSRQQPFRRDIRAGGVVHVGLVGLDDLLRLFPPIGGHVADFLSDRLLVEFLIERIARDGPHFQAQPIHDGLVGFLGTNPQDAGFLEQPFGLDHPQSGFDGGPFQR
jgi:hypothetical protein